jgi:hypothetical protein
VKSLVAGRVGEQNFAVSPGGIAFSIRQLVAGSAAGRRRGAGRRLAAALGAAFKRSRLAGLHSMRYTMVCKPLISAGCFRPERALIVVR